MTHFKMTARADQMFLHVAPSSVHKISCLLIVREEESAFWTEVRS